MALHSLQVEKHVLSGLIKHPTMYVDIAPFVKETDFYDEVHSTIFLIIKSLFEKNEKWDKLKISEKIKNIGVSFKDDINIYDYVDNLSFIPITPQAAADAAKELLKLRIRRDLALTGQEIINYVNQNGNLGLDDIITGVGAIYGKHVNAYQPEDMPRNLFEGLVEKIEERGNNPLEETGLKVPYPNFSRMFGGFKTGQVYAIASRPGEGKSTWLEDVTIKTCEQNEVKAFVCDTEMSTEDIQWRAGAAHSTVPQWYVETGQWRKSEDLTQKMRVSYEQFRKYAERKYVTHYYIGDKNLEQLITVIRRWHAANVKKGEKCIIVYDYLKLTEGESVGENWAEFQMLGQKISRLKRLAVELDAVILTAIQLNRKGEGKERQDNSASFAISDRLQWFGAFTAIFRRKSVDEINRDGQRFGTHKLIPTKTRFQGRDAGGHQNLVRRMNEEGEMQWYDDFINFQVDNFNVEEVGTLRDIVAQENNVPEEQNPHDGRTL